jgi:hypothetical protein
VPASKAIASRFRYFMTDSFPKQIVKHMLVLCYAGSQPG